MTWPTFHTEHPIKELVVKDRDMNLATLVCGFTFGLGYFVGWHAIRQTRRLHAYTVMIWGEILVCAVFAIISWLYLCGIIKYSFWFYFIILTMWALQVQFLLQIIVNRICMLLVRPKDKFWLKFIVTVWITAINASVYCIWIPAKLQISQRYHDINIRWDRIEKCLYLVTNGALSYTFVRLIKQKLMMVGEHEPLLKFNERLVVVSLAMDLMIIIAMSHPNDFIYMQFHPLAYLVKLEIELCMSNLLLKVLRLTEVTVHGGERRKAPNLESNKGRGRVTGPLSHAGNSANTRIWIHKINHSNHHENNQGNNDLEPRVAFDDPKAEKLSSTQREPTARRWSVINQESCSESTEFERCSRRPDIESANTRPSPYQG